ncbi:MAG: GNAT family N-acetyltransferase [Phycisphaerae bacterium]|nr:GNAT family N-acetyltransferase [Phycisphaerae bacterium]
MATPALQIVPLRGRFIDMVPLTEAHAPSLLENTTRDSFTYFRHDDPEWTPEGMARFVRECIDMPDRAPFATVLKATGEAIGSSSYCDIRLANKGIEIGWTWLGKDFRGTKANPESKLLLMTYAFETLGCVRVQLKCDARNQLSHNAISKLGAVREGVLRKHVIVRNGFIRDSVLFSITQEEWPAVKAGLEKRVAM